jgi:GTP-binding protein EngB required for normal cell division
MGNTIQLGQIMGAAPVLGLRSGAAVAAGKVIAAGGTLTAGIALLLRAVRASRGRPPQHIPTPGSDDAAEYPCPEWLDRGGKINLCVSGQSGVGKSSFINAIRRLRPGEEGAARVGVRQTTFERQAYAFAGFSAALIDDCERLWDVPGGGTLSFPIASYIKDMGLRYFDCVIIIVDRRLTEIDKYLAERLNSFRVPFFVVRSKVDRDIEDNEHDNGIPAQTTVYQLREEMIEFGFPADRVFLISSRQPNNPLLDFQKLLVALANIGSVMGLIARMTKMPACSCLPGF